MKVIICCIVLLVSFVTCSTVKLIIDTDGVYDDIRGLSIALTYSNVEVLGITTVHGGVSANQSAANVARLLKAVGKESVPIFLGSNDSIVPKGPVIVWEDLFGSDGIGGVPDAYPRAISSNFLNIQSKSAIDAIIELTKNSSNVTLVGLGPLTNIALALKKDPELAKRLGKVVIMGGNYLGVGNTQSNSTAEFNFLMDPEAAKIVLESIRTVIVPWDTCFFKRPEYSELVDYEESLRQRTELSNFLSNITAKGREYNNATHQQYAFVDDIAVAIAISPEIVSRSMKLCANVELSMDSITRGQVAIDWLSTGYNPKTRLFEALDDKNDQNWLTHTFVTEFDVVRVNQMLMEAVLKSKKT